MADIEATARNDEKFFATSRVGDFELSIDATGNEGPTPDEIIVADYAACYSFAFRAGAQREHDLSLGKIRTEAEAELEDDYLAAISLTVHVEDDLDDDQVESLIGLGEEICHVHRAVKPDLHADIDVVPNADL
jgi:organic hydroperoxide reductase OsmC/OhrA